MFARRLPLLALLLLAMSPGAVPAQDFWRAIPYERLHEAFSSVKPLEGARYIRLDRRIATTAPDMTLDDVRMVIGAAGGDIEVPIDGDGTLAFPMSEALLEENPPVRVNVPEGQLSINVQIDTSVPPAESFPYALVAEMADEYALFVKEQGMLARMMAPDPEGLRVEFPDGVPATATVTGPGGETIEADPDGKLVVPIRKDWRAGNREVVLSRMPAAMRLAVEQ